MRVGILVIGSLLWDNSERETWRRTRLNLDEQIPVRAPIRYGRRSRTRGNTFTMVFRNDGIWGQAVLVPCLSSMMDVDDLLQEASALWSAEKLSASQGEVGASWGCVGVLFRREDETSINLAKEWGQYFQKHSDRPIAPVDLEGILHIPWPEKLDNSPLTEVDVILSTATQAEKTLPTAEEIADAWINQDSGHERYFFENVRHGIRTAEDLEIWSRIEERSPRWLSKQEYAEVIAFLRSGTA